MANGRPIKRGMTWTPWDTDIFDDERIFELISTQGWKGFSVYFYLCQKIYGLEGYYIKCATPSFACMTAQKMGGGVGAETVQETIRFCLRLGLFDSGLYERWGILTSHGIQKRFANGLKKKTDKTVISEYWLLNDEENSEICPCLVFRALNDSFCGEKSGFRGENGAFRSIRKEEENITHTLSAPAGASEPQAPSVDMVRAYFTARGITDPIEVTEFIRYNEARGWSCLPAWEQKADLWIAKVPKARREFNERQKREPKKKTPVSFDTASFMEAALRRTYSDNHQ